MLLLVSQSPVSLHLRIYNSRFIFVFIILGYYTFIKKKPLLVTQTGEALKDIIWSYVYTDFIALIKKAV